MKTLSVLFSLQPLQNLL